MPIPYLKDICLYGFSEFCYRTAELDQSKAGISRLRDWVSGQKKDYLIEEDIVISSSVDEILSPDTLIRWGRITAF